MEFAWCCCGRDQCEYFVHGVVAVAINANISFVKAATSGTLTAEAREQSINPKLATYLVDVTDDEGDRVATFQGMVYRKKPRPSE
ncbi:MAG: PaaI family thioesterase [Planctomycetota bacterium]